MDDLLGGDCALYAHINAFICNFGLMMLNLTCIDMNIQGVRGSKTFLAYQWLDSAVLCDIKLRLVNLDEKCACGSKRPANILKSKKTTNTYIEHDSVMSILNERNISR